MRLSAQLAITATNREILISLWHSKGLRVSEYMLSEQHTIIFFYFLGGVPADKMTNLCALAHTICVWESVLVCEAQREWPRSCFALARRERSCLITCFHRCAWARLIMSLCVECTKMISEHVYKYSDISSEVVLYNHNQYRSKTLMTLKEVLQSSLVFFLPSQVKMQKRKCSAGQEIEAHPCSNKYNSSLFTLVHADMQTFSFFLLEVLLFASFCWNTYYILSLMTGIH